MDGKSHLFHITVKETEKLININPEVIKNKKKLEDYTLEEFILFLKDASKVERTSNEFPKKIIASQEVFIYLDGQFELLVREFQNKIETLEVITEILRFLRNCTSDYAAQKCILIKTNILNNADSFFSKIIKVDVNNICLKVLLQFLINLVSSNSDAGDKILKLFYDRLKKFLQTNINIYESSALIYYISLVKPINDSELTNTVLNLHANNLQNEFLIFLLENNISHSNFWSTYQDMDIEKKITILETLRNMLLQKNVCRLPVNAQETLIEDFLRCAGSIFYMSKKEENRLKASEVSLLLEILSSLSSDENYLKKLQSNRNILINAGVLLINIHTLGKENYNCFTPVQKLSQFGVNSGLNEHPAFGFKADLIRLIGNFCWKNMDMQDLVRTAELIPVILDCCNMDARNPFIIQWSILAVRNLCENNAKNQKIIASLHQEGTVSSEVLDEMGITLQDDGENKLKIVSFDSLKKD